MQACRVATRGVLVMLAWVVCRGTDGNRHQYTLMSAETGQKFRFAVWKVFPLGVDASLPRDQLPFPPESPNSFARSLASSLFGQYAFLAE